MVLLGAKWSVYDEATIGDWIGAELDWLRQADRDGVPVLGICFGAQALSAALGGQVEPIGRPEVGWTVIESLAPEIIEPGPWLEFHSDRCLPPARATILARNGTGVQAFSVGATAARPAAKSAARFSMRADQIGISAARLTMPSSEDFWPRGLNTAARSVSAMKTHSAAFTRP